MDWDIERQQALRAQTLGNGPPPPIVEEFLGNLDGLIVTGKSETEEEETARYGLIGMFDDEAEMTEALIDRLNEVFV